MNARLSAVISDVLVVATGILKGISEDRHRGEVARIVHLLGKGEDGGSEPRRVESDGVEWIAEYAADEVCLGWVHWHRVWSLLQCDLHTHTLRCLIWLGDCNDYSNYFQTFPKSFLSSHPQACDGGCL